LDHVRLVVEVVVRAWWASGGANLYTGGSAGSYPNPVAHASIPADAANSRAEAALAERL